MRPPPLCLLAYALSACAASVIPEPRDARVDALATPDIVDARIDAAPVFDATDARSDVQPDALPLPDSASIADAQHERADSGCLTAPDVSPAHPPPADPRCPAGRWMCDGACVDLVGNDPSNCGACGLRCCGGWCFSGTCGAEGPPGITACGTRCRADCVGPIPVRLDTDTNHCGACDVVCASGQQCRQGICTE